MTDPIERLRQSKALHRNCARYAGRRWAERDASFAQLQTLSEIDLFEKAPVNELRARGWLAGWVASEIEASVDEIFEDFAKPPVDSFAEEFFGAAIDYFKEVQPQL